MSENLGRDGRVEELYWEQLGTLISSRVESVSLFLFFFAANKEDIFFIFLILGSYKLIWVWQVTSKL